MNTPPRNDAAPLAGGAGVTSPNTSPDSTLARLHLAPPAHHNAPPGTSSVAADRIAGHARNLRAAVLAVLRERGEYGATDQEIQVALNLSSDTQVPRRWELVKARMVVASGRKRKTRSGCPATVWVLAEFAPKPTTIATVASASAAGAEGGAA